MEWAAKDFLKFIRIIEQSSKVTGISNLTDKLNWLVSYIELDIYNEWSSFEEFKAGN